MSAKYWNDPNKGNFNQNDNATEYLVTKINNAAEKDYILYRESCHGSSIASCIEVIGGNLKGDIIQPEDAYNMAMNDYKKYPLMQKSAIPGNRFFRNGPIMLRSAHPELEVSDVIFFNGMSKNEIRQVIKSLLTKENTACVMHTPGHYFAGHHYEDGYIYGSNSAPDVVTVFPGFSTTKGRVSLDYYINNLLGYGIYSISA